MPSLADCLNRFPVLKSIHDSRKRAEPMVIGSVFFVASYYE